MHERKWSQTGGKQHLLIHPGNSSQSLSEATVLTLGEDPQEAERQDQSCRLWILCQSICTLPLAVEIHGGVLYNLHVSKGKQIKNTVERAALSKCGPWTSPGGL